ncbi:hypothetical protein A9Q99_18705 [Gammaproteobacteria bacterium 45_16_T64]|nr:hypothetical protein A9Q99_18705 [Gammaproteobacteria bacterium 45_16_T64]
MDDLSSAIGSNDDEINFSEMPLFNDVEIEPLEVLLRQCVMQNIVDGELILDPGEGNHFFYLILRGVFSVHLDSTSNLPIATLSVGECVGEMSMFDGKNPSAYVKANGTAIVLAMDSATLWEMIDLSHGFCRNLLHILSKRVRMGNTVVTDSLLIQEQHKRDATIDVLTGLQNRRWLNDLLLRLDQVSLDDIAPLTIMMLDIDHFKRFNDNYGHQLGDEVLAKVADVMQRRLRPIDKIARYGGEEFIVILPSSTVSAAKIVAERLRQGVESLRIMNEGKPLVPVTISIGISQWNGCQDIESTISSADKALYEAKSHGRNRFSCYP